MKNYERKYEYVFTDKTKLCNRFDIKNLSIYQDDPKDIDTYINMLRSEIDGFKEMAFDYIVKVTWLYRRFIYRGARRSKRNANGHALDAAFKFFMREYVGVNNKFVFVGSILFSRISAYVDDLFPDFDSNNPFVVKYEYPYKNVPLDYLAVVYNMSERLEILSYVEEHPMSYSEFLDWIINYINCYNDEHGDTYTFWHTRDDSHYVRKIKK